LGGCASDTTRRRRSGCRAHHPQLPVPSDLAPYTDDRILLTLASAGVVNLIVGSIVAGVVFIQLPTTVRPAGFVGVWLIGLLLVLALVLSLHLYSQRDNAEG